MADVLNIAHRGCRSLAPENTLAAARKALEIGADMWELDVGVTADGELIVIHDDSLGRTTNVDTIFPDRTPWHFTTFTLSEIKQLDTASAFIQQDAFEQIAAGAVSADDLAAMEGEPIPTLREALRFTRDHNWRVNVEIKRIPPPMESFPVADKVVALIEELDMGEQVIISSFVPLNLKRAKELNPAIKIAVLTEGQLSLSQHLTYGFDPFGEIPRLQYFSGDDPVRFLTELGATTYHPNYLVVNRERIKALQQAGIALNIWTVNDREHMKRLIEVGVNGIITDFPQVLAQLLSEYKA